MPNKQNGNTFSVCLGYLPTAEFIEGNSSASVSGGRQYGAFTEIDLSFPLTKTRAQKFLVITAVMGGILLLRELKCLLHSEK